MKPATFAPFYCTLYPNLCEVARTYGYALAIHGTVTSDLDLIACPWTENAASPETLKEKLMECISACDYEQHLVRFGLTPEQAEQIALRSKEANFTVKPHGRMAWNLYLDNGVKVDLSVWPRQAAACTPYAEFRQTIQGELMLVLGRPDGLDMSCVEAIRKLGRERAQSTQPPAT